MKRGNVAPLAPHARRGDALLILSAEEEWVLRILLKTLIDSDTLGEDEDEKYVNVLRRITRKLEAIS